MPVLRAHTQACLFYVPIRRHACSTGPYAGVPVLRAHTQACLSYVPIRRRACSTCPFAGVPVLRAHSQACLFYVPICRRACSTCPYAGVPVLRAPGPVADPGGRAHEALGQGQAGHRCWGRVATKSHLGSHSVILNYGLHAIKIF
jgi:hypothetical protein